MRAYVLFGCAVFFAFWLLLWFCEALNVERLAAINSWAVDNNILVVKTSGSGEIPGYYPDYITYGTQVQPDTERRIFIPRGNDVWAVDLAPPLGP
jgi:hypothetical protein